MNVNHITYGFFTAIALDSKRGVEDFSGLVITTGVRRPKPLSIAGRLKEFFLPGKPPSFVANNCLFFIASISSFCS